MSRKTSRRTLAKLKRPCERIEVDWRRRLADRSSEARSGRTPEMGARWLVARGRALSAFDRRRRGLVAGKQQAHAPDILPYLRAVPRERPGSVARRKDVGNSRLFRAGE